MKRPPRVQPPSIGARLGRSMLLWTLIWSVAVGGAVLLSASHEVGELLDDTLQSSAELMVALLAQPGLPAPAGVLESPTGGAPGARFAWQVSAADGALLMRSAHAPQAAWRTHHRAGFSSSDDWRIYGLPLGSDGQMLHVAQTHAERREAQFEVAAIVALAALTIGLLGQLWLRQRLRTELKPLRDLSQRLADWDVGHSDVGVALGPAERAELQPVHDAIEGLTHRLTVRIANERAFASNAAHALRTPLAGIDAQLAVALRECPPSLQGRLQRVRDAAARLHGVVTALLGLFRSGAGPQRERLDVAALAARLPTALLDVQVAAGTVIDADPDLLAAALLNLLDNAQRHGARHVHIRRTHTGLRMTDDGPGVGAEQRLRMQAAVAAQDYSAVGLGLMLADRVARAHGGLLLLPAADRGFAVELDLGAAAPAEPASGGAA